MSVTTRTPLRIHPTALVEDNVSIGGGTSVWDNVHIRLGAQIGHDCIIGGKSYIGPGVKIGDRVKINANVYIPAGVTIETGAMISAGVIFTNDLLPRATTPDLGELRSSAVGSDTMPTYVREGATLGAGSVIGCGLEIGPFAMTGMGAVVTHDVGAHHLVIGVPAATHAAICRCGMPVVLAVDRKLPDEPVATCPDCDRVYRIAGGIVFDREVG